ncbi:SDR family NAD(P)-dependent oxidoreductase [Entomobacter blattae]|uniref:3-oxoacyl-[acyl-carrier-protein] reductase FabG n=1 Tax=Entomobacter blattae TaxID=2762277 RepID=A0A7H1NR39_9PROT|nr:glucose 1-dehydrogenase [Entomobacter blattae]QNT78249.1 3-oxoacyl-[acyl-carrier-protein] reductase FabG [Entomobacter blattae]
MRKVALITGALTGIGHETALLFAKNDFKLVVSGRRDEAGKALEAELQKLGAEAFFFKSDVQKEDQVKALVDFCLSKFGRLDVAVNNAGTEGKALPLTDVTTESYYYTFDTNVLGVILSLKYELAAMYKQKSGTIINMSSIAGKMGSPSAGLYVASKHAVEGLTKTAALEAAPFDVKVNAIAPGPIATRMFNDFIPDDSVRDEFVSAVPLKRVGEVSDIANMALYIAQGKSPYMTGASITIDGGMLA